MLANIVLLEPTLNTMCTPEELFISCGFSNWKQTLHLSTWRPVPWLYFFLLLFLLFCYVNPCRCSPTALHEATKWMSRSSSHLSSIPSLQFISHKICNSANWQMSPGCFCPPPPSSSCLHTLTTRLRAGTLLYMSSVYLYTADKQKQPSPKSMSKWTVSLEEQCWHLFKWKSFSFAVNPFKGIFHCDSWPPQ